MLTPRIFGNSVVVTTTNANGSVPLSPSTILTIPAACGGLGQVSSIAFSPRGDLVAAASAAKGVLVWSLNSMTLVKTLTAPFGAIATAIAFNLDGSEIAIGTNGGGIALHNVDNGEVEEFYTDAEGCTAITFSEDSHWIGICSKSQVCYFDQNNDNPNVRSLLVDGYEHQIGELSSLQFSRDGEFVAACTTDGQHVLQWSTASGELLRSSITPMVPLTNASRVCGVREWRGMPDALSSIHENGLVYCWCYEGTANVRSVNDDSLLMTAAFVGPATCVAMSPDMNWVAVGTASNGIAVCPLPTAHHVARRVTAAALVMGSPPTSEFSCHCHGERSAHE
ncbi:Hypothetical protein, putative [Bodo saltans]|uniref:Anaphase-promoting complex subunit 4-like WD40 domain-containing protein n=1 Tax=Bodo saltans TaxID=75058 RepID=A0A0S4J3H9_BODSA|nr:Hypothetical protein, putative [Bodo saltans]|eukprot:CUG58205.1 Hypothetical protein, putative [Bodo saltans]